MIESIWKQIFRAHDFACDILVQHLLWIKRGLLLVAFGGFLGVGFPELRKDFGELSLNILLALLFLSPLSRIFRMRILLLAMGLRREFGILMGCFALVHVLGYLLDSSWFLLFVAPYTPDILGMEQKFLLGFIAFALTLPLLFTSNGFSQRVLGRNWKRLHWLAYPLLLFVLFHKFVHMSGDTSGYVRGVAVFGVYLIAKLLAYRNFLSPLRAVIEYVARRYETYRDGLVLLRTNI